MQAISEWIVNISNLVTVIFLSVTVWTIYSLYKGKPTWGQARAMGSTALIFIWIQGVFYLAMAESVYVIVSIFANLNPYIDIFIFLTVIIVAIFIYIKLSSRATFKPALFLGLVLVPLGFQSAGLVLKSVKTGALEISQKVIYFAKYIDKPVEQAAKNIWPQKKLTIAGYVTFKESHEKGTFGDSLTARRLTAMGFKKLDSKIDSIHGIDGVYIRESNGNYEIKIIENKVDGSKLSKGQMSDEWVKERAVKLLNSDDKSKQLTGKTILDAYKNNNYSKELWTYDLGKGTLKIDLLDSEAKKASSGEIPKGIETFIKNSIKEACNFRKFECELKN